MIDREAWHAVAHGAKKKEKSTELCLGENKVVKCDSVGKIHTLAFLPTPDTI